MSDTPAPLGTVTPSRDLSRALEQALARFEAALRTGQRPRIEDHLPPDGPERRRVLIELVHTELEHRLKAGERRLVGQYLQRFPELTEGGEAVDLIAAEYRVIRRLDATVRLDDYLAGYPAHADRVRTLIGREAEAAGPRVEGYELLGVLGRGGMGVVYKAQHLKLNRVVALKMVLAGDCADDAERERLRREAAAAARLQHPNIVQVFEVGEQHGRPFIALEFVAGGSLEQKTSGNPQPVLEAARLVEMLARAVQHAHEHDVVHRDLKPANVLLAPAEAADEGVRLPGGAHRADAALGWVPKVADFGLAKRLEGSAGQTRSGAVVGTPSYMAPEQAAGKPRLVGPRSDVYALGALLYELLTGRPPFKAETPVDTLLQVLHDEPVTPRRLNPKCPRDLETITLKCLRKDASDRYGTAAALADDLRRYRDGEPIQARPPGTGERAVRWLRKRPTVVLAVLLALLTVVGSLGGYRLWLMREQARSDYERIKREAEARERAEADAAAEKVAYFAGYVWKNGEPWGVAPVTEAEAARRHRTFRFVRTGGLLERVEVVNGLGTAFRGDPLQAAPAWDQPFASARLDASYRPRRTRDGRLQAVEVRDRNDFVRAVCQGPLESTSSWTEVGDPLLDGGALTATYRARFTWGDGGLLREAHFVNVQGKPTRNSVGAYGHRWDYDERGIPNRRTWLGPKGEPWDARDGTCRTDFTLDPRGDVVAGAYFDAAGKPVRNAQGIARWTILRDDAGNEVERAFFDEEGRPLHSEGVHKRVLTCDGRGNAIRHQFFDAQGRPVLRRGACGSAPVCDDQGNIVEETFLDADGRPARSEDGFARRRMKHDGRGNLIEVTYFEADDRPASGPEGAHRVVVRHDFEAGVSEVSLFDAGGKPAADRRGVARWVVKRDGAGREVERSFFGTDGKPHRLAEGYAMVRRDIDAAGTWTGERFFDGDGKPATHRDGYHRWQRGQLVLAQGLFILGDDHIEATRYVGPDDKPVLHRDGYYAVGVKRNDHGDEVQGAFLGTGPLLAANRAGFALWKAEYDERGNQTEIAWLGLSSEPVVTHSGAARVTRTFDRCGRSREEVPWALDRVGQYVRVVTDRDGAGRVAALRYLTEKGEPAVHLDGHHVQKNDYDEQGRIREATFFGLAGEPVNSRFRGHRWKCEYNEAGRLAAQSFFDVTGRAVARAAGFHRQTYTYDGSGLCVDERFFDAAGRPVVIRAGYARITRSAGPDGRVEELFWDLDAAGDYGRFVVERLDPAGQRELIFVDEKGRPATHRDGYCRRVEKADGQSREGEVTHFDARGAKVLTADGIHGFRAKYGPLGEGLERERTFFGLDGKPAARRDGVFRIRRGKNPSFGNGFLIWEERLNRTSGRLGFAAFDGNGQPVLTGPDGVHRWIHTLDAQDREVRRVCLDVGGEPILSRQGYHRYDEEFDRRGRLMAQAYFGCDGEPVAPFGFATYRRRRDAAGRLEAIEFRDANGRPLRIGCVLDAPAAGSTAEQLGLKAGDVLVRYDGKDVTDPAEFLRRWRSQPAGAGPKEATLHRGDQEIRVKLPSDGKLGVALRVQLPGGGVFQEPVLETD